MRRRHLLLSFLFSLPLPLVLRRSGTKARQGWILRGDDS